MTILLDLGISAMKYDRTFSLGMRLIDCDIRIREIQEGCLFSHIPVDVGERTIHQWINGKPVLMQWELEVKCSRCKREFKYMEGTHPMRWRHPDYMPIKLEEVFEGLIDD